MGWFAIVVATLLSPLTLTSAMPSREANVTGAIVYELEGDLFAIAADGSRTVRLTRTRIVEWKPAVSPDGSRIAYTRGSYVGGFDEGIWTMKLDGSERRRVTAAGSDPAWSPDGRTLYFVRYRRGPGSDSCGSIFRVPAPGGPLRRITRSSGVHSHLAPAVSPNGARIAFEDWKGCAGGTSSPRLRVVDRMGRPTQDLGKLPHNGYYPNPEHSSPAWSPDGRRLAFLRDSDLAVARRDGSGERRLARGNGSLIYVAPAWSSDGRWIAFSTGDSPSAPSSLRIIRPDGAGLLRLAENRRGANYSIGGWLPRLPAGV